MHLPWVQRGSYEDTLGPAYLGEDYLDHLGRIDILGALSQAQASSVGGSKISWPLGVCVGIGEIGWFPKTRGTILGVFIIIIIVYWVYNGSPHCWKVP